MNPSTKQLLRQFDWPCRRFSLGSLRYFRTFSPIDGWAKGLASAQAHLELNDRHLVARVHHHRSDGGQAHVLEAQWDLLPGQAPVLTHFARNGEDQPLCSTTALQRFRGQTFLLNVAPRWGR